MIAGPSDPARGGAGAHPSATAGNSLGAARYALVRCLYGPRPEWRARHLVADVLATAGVSAELSEVELAVHEMVSNARQHAPGPYELRIAFDRGVVHIAVLDCGADHVELGRKLARAAAARLTEDESGRGLQIVTGLFPDRWGAGPASTCTGLTPAKQVWITISQDAAPGLAG